MNGLVLKSLKPKWSGLKLKKKMVWPGPGQNVAFLFETGPGLKFLSVLRAGPRLQLYRQRLGLKNPTSDL